MAKTLYEKLFEQHVVCQQEDGQYVLYIDRHLIYECTSPQAFNGLRAKNRSVRRPDLTLATTDHTVPTAPRANCSSTRAYIQDPASLTQCLTLARNARNHHIPLIPLSSPHQGIVHVVGPELGFTQPGTTLVCGDSHTSTHGALGALAFGIGTSEVEHVLATQTVVTTKAQRTIRITVVNKLRAPAVGPKDLALAAIAALGGTAGGTGAALEFAGEGVAALAMEARMVLCNMAIEAGARTGLVAPDATTIAWLRWRPGCPAPGTKEWREACRYWRALRSDEDAVFDREVVIDAAKVEPMVTWGTSPEHAVPVTGGVVPGDDEEDEGGEQKRSATLARALEYMGVTPGERLMDLAVDVVFIGSCTNSRLSDLRTAADVLRRARRRPAVVAPNVRRALVVPGSGAVKRAAEAEGLHTIFLEAGFEWREPGCSMCCGLNGDALRPGERCASTSNRNFENRQGAGGRTHLVSPAMAAAAALKGRLCDVRDIVDDDVEQGVEERATPVRDVAFELDWGLSSPWKDDVDDLDQDQPSPPSGSHAAALTTFTTLTGIPAPLNRANIDTDTILPVEFCKTIERSGAGLFHKLRYLPGAANEDPEFVLNQRQYSSASILVAGANFGCGSSREHAVWAIQGFGFRCVVAPSFADIFYNNAFKNGLLPISLPDKKALARVISEAEQAKAITVDLLSKEIRNDAGHGIAEFDVEEHRRRRLMEGSDDIASTLKMDNEITRFERDRRQTLPWIDESTKFLHDIEGRAKELLALHRKNAGSFDW